VFLTAGPEADSPLRVKVLDFGLAKLLGTEAGQGAGTRSGNLMGTPLYMSPEQSRHAGRVDHRTDIYSLGCIAFEALAGEPPFVDDGIAALLVAHATQEPPLLAARAPGVPAPVEGLIRRLLAKDPAARPASTAEVAVAFRALAEALPRATRPFRVTPPLLPSVGPADDSLRPAPASLPATVAESAAAPRPVASRPSGRRGWAMATVAAVAAFVVAGYLTVRPAADAMAPPAVSAQPATAIVDVADPPPGLTVTLDGAPASFPLTLARDGRSHRLELRAPGRPPFTQLVEASHSQVIKLDLPTSTTDTPATAAPVPTVAALPTPSTSRPKPHARPGRTNARRVPVSSASPPDPNLVTDL